MEEQKIDGFSIAEKNAFASEMAATFNSLAIQHRIVFNTNNEINPFGVARPPSPQLVQLESMLRNSFVTSPRAAVQCENVTYANASFTATDHISNCSARDTQTASSRLQPHNSDFFAYSEDFVLQLRENLATNLTVHDLSGPSGTQIVDSFRSSINPIPKPEVNFFYFEGQKEFDESKFCSQYGSREENIHNVSEEDEDEEEDEEECLEVDEMEEKHSAAVKRSRIFLPKKFRKHRRHAIAYGRPKKIRTLKRGREAIVGKFQTYHSFCSKEAKENLARLLQARASRLAAKNSGGMFRCG